MSAVSSRARARSLSLCIYTYISIYIIIYIYIDNGEEQGHGHHHEGSQDIVKGGGGGQEVLQVPVNNGGRTNQYVWSQVCVFGVVCGV